MSANPLIVALDTADLGRLAALAEALGPEVGLLKVGQQAFTAHGPAAVAAAARHAPVFLDLKLHDIPNTVAGAAAAAGDAGAAMLTVHASGGPAMVAAAAQAAPQVTILGVTVLTSLDDASLAAVGQPPAGQQVPRLARLAVDAGAGGVVCAPPEVAAVRGAVGGQPAIVVPGVRAQGAGVHDQARTGTARAALDAGASHLVVGRPVTGAEDPPAAARALRAQAAGRQIPEQAGRRAPPSAIGGPVGDLLADLGVLQHGHFRLTSGAHSDTYLQCAQALQHPRHAADLGAALARKTAHLGVDAVAAPAIGGVLAGFTVASALGCRFVFAERDPQGRMAFRRGQGPRAGERILLVEDVITTGGSVMEVAGLVESAGARVEGIAALVDRSGGALTTPVTALTTVSPSVWEASRCPLCAQGEPVSGPGSRNAAR